jgi:hypothetical protein
VLAWAVYFFATHGFPTLPLDGSGGDLPGWEATGHYLFSHINFFPIPRIDYFTNDHFYPEGIPAVYQSWGFERDYWYALMRYLAGPGPWLQYYFLISQVILAGSAFIMLQSKLKSVYALLLATLLSFGNIYALTKYPGHYGLSIVHWSILGVLADSLLCQSVADRKVPSVLIILFRIFCLLAGFGLELAYIQGINLTSFLVSSLFMVLLGAIYFFFYGIAGVRKLSAIYKQQFKTNKFACGTLIFAILGVSFFYVPLLLQLFIAVKKVETIEVVSGSGLWWADWKRILLPYIQPFYDEYQGQFADVPEGYPAYSIGWTLLCLVAFSLFSSLRRLSFGVIPTLGLAAAILTFRPYAPLGLSLLPWFSYARVGPRLSFVLPAIAIGLAANVYAMQKDSKVRSSWLIRLGIVLVLLLGICEAPFYYSNLARTHSEAPIEPEFFQHMKKVAASRGEAVLDWPFCYKGGDSRGYCPFSNLDSIWANKKYHNKKVLGTYFARLPASYNDFYKQFGLHQLLEKQTQGCLPEDDLYFLKAFLNYHDFAGMHLYSSVINEDCISRFMAVFGEPLRQVQFPGIGLVFYFESEHLFDQVPISKRQSTHLIAYVEGLRTLRRSSLRDSIKKLYVPADEVDFYTILAKIMRYTDIEVEPYRAASDLADKAVYVVSKTTSIEGFEKRAQMEDSFIYSKEALYSKK